MEQKILNVPKISQLPGSYCGVACLNMCFSYYGINISQKQLSYFFDNSEIIPQAGVHLEDMIKVAKTFQFRTKKLFNLNLNKVISLIDSEIPVVTLISNYLEVTGEITEKKELKKYKKLRSGRDSSHSIIFKGYNLNESLLYIIDPQDLRRKKLNFSQFDIARGPVKDIIKTKLGFIIY